MEERLVNRRLEPTEVHQEVLVLAWEKIGVSSPFLDQFNQMGRSFLRRQRQEKYLSLITTTYKIVNIYADWVYYCYLVL